MWLASPVGFKRAGRTRHALLSAPDRVFVTGSPTVDVDPGCPRCNGHRWVMGGLPCRACNPDGAIYPF